MDNRSLAPNDDITRYKLLLDKPPHANRLHIFGAPLMWVPSVKVHSGKLAPRGWRGTFLGVDDSQVVVLDSSSKRLVYNRNVEYFDAPMSEALATTASQLISRLQPAGANQQRQQRAKGAEDQAAAQLVMVSALVLPRMQPTMAMVRALPRRLLTRARMLLARAIMQLLSNELQMSQSSSASAGLSVGRMK